MNYSLEPPSGSVSKALVRFNEIEEKASQLIWDRYFERLRDFANGKIYPRHKRLFDGEDIAGSALLTLMNGLRENRFGDLKNRDQLWQMLVVIATRKTLNSAAFHDRVKRGGGKVQGGSAIENAIELKGLNGYFEQDQDPAKFVEFEMTCQELLNALPSEGYRQITLMRLAGFSNVEIAKKTGCSRRTIDRKLNAIRLVWAELHDKTVSNLSDEQSEDANV